MVSAVSKIRMEAATYRVGYITSCPVSEWERPGLLWNTPRTCYGDTYDSSRVSISFKYRFLGIFNSHLLFFKPILRVIETLMWMDINIFYRNTCYKYLTVGNWLICKKVIFCFFDGLGIFYLFFHLVRTTARLCLFISIIFNIKRRLSDNQ